MKKAQIRAEEKPAPYVYTTGFILDEKGVFAYLLKA